MIIDCFYRSVILLSMKTMGGRIREARERTGLTQAELAAKIGVTTVTIWRWEGDQRPPRSDYIDKIAEALETTVSFIMGQTSEIPAARFLNPDDWYELPMLDPTAVACAGSGNGGMEGILLESSRTIQIPREWLGIISVDADKRPYGIRVEGDSMVEAGIPDGADVAINPAAEVREGDPALVSYGHRCEWAVKWVHYHPDGSIELRSSSPRYPNKIFTREDIEAGFMRILGRVICSLVTPKRNV